LGKGSEYVVFFLPCLPKGTAGRRDFTNYSRSKELEKELYKWSVGVRVEYSVVF
jgi:hypothetical protein